MKMLYVLSNVVLLLLCLSWFTVIGLTVTGDIPMVDVGNKLHKDGFAIATLLGVIMLPISLLNLAIATNIGGKVDDNV